MGRPSTKTPEIVAAICARLETGESLAQICRDDGMPAVRTAHEWRETDETVAAAFARAREIGYDVIADRLRKTARGKTEDSDGESTGDVQRDKLIVETDLKLLAKWSPKRYGDKIGIGQAEGMEPMQTKTTLDVTRLSSAALAEIASLASD